MGARANDLTGKVFGLLTVRARAPNKGRWVVWRCECICGTKVSVYAHNLTSGSTRSCGCLRTTGQTIQGQGSHTPEYSAWSNMKGRCFNPGNKRYPDYGGRGIIVCDEWRLSFAQFLLDVGPRPSGTHSLDRINNDGNYEPGNCRWATPEEQRSNRRMPKNHRFKHCPACGFTF